MAHAWIGTPQKGSRPTPTATWLAAVALAGLVINWPADAQDPRAKAPFVAIAPILLAEPGGDTEIAIQVGPAEAIPRNSFVRLRGLPPGALLTDGHSVSPGSWAIPIAGLTGLKVTAQPTLQGRSQIEVALVTADGGVLAQARAALVFAPVNLVAPPPAELRDGSAALRAGAAITPAVQPPAQSGPALAAPLAPARPIVTEREDVRKLRQRGEALLADGNIAQARLFFQRAAEGGSGLAAMALARTYDPEELVRLGTLGLQPDSAMARRWYERARDLGVAEAAERLARLAGR
jgi:hypothetical protein